MMLVRGIWLNWNDWMRNQKKLSAVQIVNLVQTMCEEWKAVQNYAENGMVSDTRHTGSRGITGYGCYIRHCQGTFVKALSGWNRPELLVQEGEPFALLNSIRWVQEMGLSGVTFLSFTNSGGNYTWWS